MLSVGPISRVIRTWMADTLKKTHKCTSPNRTTRSGRFGLMQAQPGLDLQAQQYRSLMRPRPATLVAPLNILSWASLLGSTLESLYSLPQTTTCHGSSYAAGGAAVRCSRAMMGGV